MKTKTRAEKIAHNKAERRISEAYRLHCCGVAIPIMSIPPIFKYGHEVIAQGATDAELAVKLAAYVAGIVESGK